MNQWIEWAKQIASIAETGLYFTENPYDKERYEKLTQIATDMLSAYSDADPKAIHNLLKMDDGYITPKVDVRGAVFKDDKILLVREAADGLWTLPGGWADVGDAPSEAIEREIWEESGYEAKATKLLAVEDRKRRHPPHIFEIYKVCFLCDLVGGEAKTSMETTAVDWFSEDNLPDLSTGRVTEEQLHRWFKHYRQPDLPTEFD